MSMSLTGKVLAIHIAPVPHGETQPAESVRAIAGKAPKAPPTHSVIPTGAMDRATREPWRSGGTLWFRRQGGMQIF